MGADFVAPAALARVTEPLLHARMIPPAYEALVAKLRRMHLLSTVEGLLSWDEQVNLPPDSVSLRTSQLALMAEISHGAESDAVLGELLSELERKEVMQKLSADRRAVIREARRNFDRVTRLPADFVRDKAVLSSRSYHAWVAARKDDDFPAFEPFLRDQLEFARKEAAYLGHTDRPYDYFIDRHDPGMTAEVVDLLFSELKEGLVPFARAVLASPVRPAENLLRGFPVDGQRVFLDEVTRRIGFDYRRGRIDVSPHPFCGGTGEDIRMTTRFSQDTPLESLFGAIHETGHGLYEQGLPAEHAGTALGMAAGMGVHESQSRLWENQVGRSRGFWRHFESRFRELFPLQTKAIDSESLYLAINAMRGTPIRVAADEVTYNLHILLRFDLEKRLFSGELGVGDLSQAWRRSSSDLLGIDPGNDRDGVLQDVHWSYGEFGYFPSYCLGNMLAAQLWYTAREALPGLEDDFARGEFGRLLDWLRVNVHARARRIDILALTREVTGEELSPKALLRYLAEKYSKLYRL